VCHYASDKRCVDFSPKCSKSIWQPGSARTSTPQTHWLDLRHRDKGRGETGDRTGEKEIGDKREGGEKEKREQEGPGEEGEGQGNVAPQSFTKSRCL